jgi:zeta-carotene desaturase
VRADVIVVGGGCAGLSAATALAERGRRVLVLEARPTLGGRATAFTDPGTGERVDNGQHILMGCYHDTFRFLDRIGARRDVQLQERLTVEMIDGAGNRSRLECSSMRPPFNLLGGLATWSALDWRDRVSALRVGRAFTVRRNETVRSWLVRRGQTPRLVEMLWEPLAVAALNQSIDVAAAEPFTRVLAEMLGDDPRDASLAMPMKPLDELYTLPAKAYIEARGGEVRTSAQARIQCDGETTVVVRDESLRAATVICAVPWFALADVFIDPPAPLRSVIAAATHTAAAAIVTVNLWFDRVVTEEMLVGLPGRTFQWIFDKRRVFGEQTSHLSLISSAADAIAGESNEQLIDLACGEVRDAIPAARDATLRRAVVVREKRSTFSVAPGQPTRPSVHTGIAGLLLAGDWIDTGLPATIESAVRSGHMAAAAATDPRSPIPDPGT